MTALYTPAEQTLVAIWAELLGVERVGIHDNFFALGGDSIISIQMVSRAHQAGLQITPKLLFQHQTIAELAEVAGTEGTLQAEQGVVTGPLPLTPIQRWFFEAHPVDPHHFNQSMLLEVSPDVRPEWLARAVHGLLCHHDALRLRFTHDGAGWRQENAAPDAVVPLTVFDLSGLDPDARLEQLTAEAERIQSGLNLSSGPLMRAALFRYGPERTGRLLIVVHHLAVDGVSWRILLDDLETMYQQLRRGEAVALPAKTASFRDWSRWLAANGPDAVAAERAYWLQVCGGPCEALPIDGLEGAGDNTMASAARLSTTLAREQTTALLRDVPGVYHTQINDVLLTALLQSVCRWTGGRTVLVDLEGHGRERPAGATEDIAGAPAHDIDLTRTVGWFTSVFPVRLELDADGPGDALKSVKEQLRRIPQRGIGYGLLRYLGGAVDLAGPGGPAISFNYLGQFDATGPLRREAGAAGRAILGLASEAHGAERSPRHERDHLLEIDGWVQEGELRVQWTYSQDIHRPETVAALAADYVATLETLIAHCASPEAGGYTPSDFPHAGLDQRSLDRVLAGAAGAGVEDIYELSPMQAGMLFDTLYAPESSVYTTQTCLTFDRTLDPAAWRRAWQRVLERHPALRTGFCWDGQAKPLQVVRERPALPWATEDWRTGAPPHADLQAFLESDRRRPFDLSGAPLMRCVLIRVDEETSVFVWTSHHILVDGWSMPILLQELLACYEAEARSEALSLPRPRPYREYIAWLRRQDRSAAQAFWRRTLQGFTAVARLHPTGRRDPSESILADTDVVVTLPPSVRGDLERLARSGHLTPNAIVLGAWALLLRGYTGLDDVLFGATVSGRPAALAGVESIVGLFINTLPLRVQVRAEASVLSLLQAIQQQQAEQAEYAHMPLADIQQCSKVLQGGALFDSIVVFENYPFDSGVKTRLGQCVREIRSIEHSPVRAHADRDAR